MSSSASFGSEYKKLQRREKLLDVVVRERTKRACEESYLKLKAANCQALLGLAEAIEAKDSYTKGHCGRVAAYAMALAGECGYPAEDMEALEFASFLHDIGKIGVRDAVLLKPGPLDAKEWEHMRTHPLKGYEIASQIDMLKPTMPCIRNHHGVAGRSVTPTVSPARRSRCRRGSSASPMLTTRWPPIGRTSAPCRATSARKTSAPPPG